MFKGKIASSSVISAGTSVPFAQVYNTNANTSFDGTDVTINTSGMYDIFVTLVVTNVASGSISMQLYDNGTAIGDAIVTETSAAATDNITLHIDDVIRVYPVPPGQNVKLSVELSANATISNGTYIVQKVR